MIPVIMREPCPKCDCESGNMTTVSGQDTVRCAWCDTFCYNAPKTETGREVRSLSKREKIKPSTRTRVFLRDGDACIICRSTERLEVGHLISVADGDRYNIDADLINSDENLAAMCATCNNGISDETVPIRLIVKAFMVRHYRKQPGTGDQVHNTVSKEQTQ